MDAFSSGGEGGSSTEVDPLGPTTVNGEMEAERMEAMEGGGGGGVEMEEEGEREREPVVQKGVRSRREGKRIRQGFLEA